MLHHWPYFYLVITIFITYRVDCYEAFALLPGAETTDEGDEEDEARDDYQEDDWSLDSAAGVIEQNMFHSVRNIVRKD